MPSVRKKSGVTLRYSASGPLSSGLSGGWLSIAKPATDPPPDSGSVVVTAAD